MEFNRAYMENTNLSEAQVQAISDYFSKRVLDQIQSNSDGNRKSRAEIIAEQTRLFEKEGKKTEISALETLEKLTKLKETLFSRLQHGSPNVREDLQLLQSQLNAAFPWDVDSEEKPPFITDTTATLYKMTKNSLELQLKQQKE